MSRKGKGHLVRVAACTPAQSLTAAMLDIEIALNYGQGTGSAQMLRFVTEHTEVCGGPVTGGGPS